MYSVMASKKSSKACAKSSSSSFTLFQSISPDALFHFKKTHKTYRETSTPTLSHGLPPRRRRSGAIQSSTMDAKARSSDTLSDAGPSTSTWHGPTLTNTRPTALGDMMRLRWMPSNTLHRLKRLRLRIDSSASSSESESRANHLDLLELPVEEVSLRTQSPPEASG